MNRNLLSQNGGSIDMNAELERLTNALIEETRCCICDSLIEIRADDLEQDTDDLYVAVYYCPGCDVGYDIEVRNKGGVISFKAFRKDITKEEDLAQISRQTSNEGLQGQSHPASNLVDNSLELVKALSILFENQQRLQEPANTIREEGFKQNEEFQRKVKTDLHNYMASAFSFEEIVGDMKPKLPRDSKVELAEEKFKEEHQIIKGLRTYAQHHLPLPFSLTWIQDENTGRMRYQITVSLDDMDDFGYRDPDISYEKVEGDRINVERRVNLHYAAAEDLVQEIIHYVESTHEEELKDFRRVTTYPTFE